MGMSRAVIHGAEMTLEQIGEIAQCVDELKWSIAAGLLEHDWVVSELQRIKKDRREEGLKVVSERKPLVVDYAKTPSLAELAVVEHPDRMDAVTIDVAKIKLIVTLADGESYVDGEENLARLKATGKVLLDICVMRAFLKHPELIPREWERMYFWGTILEDTAGNRYVAYIYLRDGEWREGIRWLGNPWKANQPAACLEAEDRPFFAARQ